ncbi:MAG: DUF3592 domain-containing protein [Clostridia bacterium]|nr:DUF3592 domain-containing protein [Clostridia bacterium]
MNLGKIAKFMRNTGPARFFIPLGVVLIIFGILSFGFNTDTYQETVGKITAVEEVPVSADEPQQFDVSFTYTADGKTYDGVFSNLTGDFKVGEEIKVLYDPADPQKITNSKTGAFFSPVLILAGVALAAFGVLRTVTAFKKSKALETPVPGGSSSLADAFDGFKTSPGVTEYYFRFDGNSLKPGYLIEDADRKVLFEGKMTKNSLVGARVYAFGNPATGSTQEHEVGHTVTNALGNEFFSVSSSFKFDGENVWDVLHDKGLRMETNLRSKFPNLVYYVTKNGLLFALIETSGKYVHEDEAAQHKLNVPSGNLYYRFWTASDDFETLFLTIFAISETEQTVVE